VIPDTQFYTSVKNGGAPAMLSAQVLLTAFLTPPLLETTICINLGLYSSTNISAQTGSQAAAITAATIRQTAIAILPSPGHPLL